VAARLTLARSLLIGSEEQLCAIALACGFADQAHFSRVFQREMGCSPGKWRREQRATPLAARIALPQTDRTPSSAVLEAPSGIAQIRLPAGMAILPAC
jgi:AraC-like DNA-binding protein